MTERPLKAPSHANDDRPAAGGRRVPIIGEIGAGGVVTFYPGADAWLEEAHRRAAARTQPDRS